MYYREDPDGSEELVPLSHDEMVADYWASGTEWPEALADLYVDFHVFSRVEFLVFQSRLSAAVFLARSTEATAQRTQEVLTQGRKSIVGARHDSVFWDEGAAVDNVDENLYALDEARAIACGAATMTAVAALESLVDDILSGVAPLAKSSGGLNQKMTRLLDRIGPPPEIRADVESAVKILRDRRNDYAHALTGSPWPPAQTGGTCRPHTKFDGETMSDTLFEVGSLAIWLEEQVERL
ncbi:hypothetical protein IFM12275_14770 [Nocardia sputorum]|uniref:hypothetical protein n=1 Tax=Nocardia TaxID=1817 RepID=UPI002491555D|nr:hypothetical protein [Nocardia sputorum]BDT91501.1 hypothetical protein IFM12275_14770 [Nocardia sputorum]